MNNKLNKKLKSNSGVSILISLVAFLVAAVVSITIVLAATSSIKTINNDAIEKQSRLTLISAAKLVRDETIKCEIVNITLVDYEQRKDNDGANGWTDFELVEGSEKNVTGFTGIFKEELKKGFDYLNTFDGDFITSFKLELNDNQLDKDIDEVNVQMKMVKNQDDIVLYYTLSLESSPYQKIYLRMIGNSSPISNSEDKKNIEKKLLNKYIHQTGSGWNVVEKDENGVMVKIRTQPKGDYISCTWTLDNSLIKEVAFND